MNGKTCLQLRTYNGTTNASLYCLKQKLQDLVYIFLYILANACLTFLAASLSIAPLTNYIELYWAAQLPYEQHPAIIYRAVPKMYPASCSSKTDVPPRRPPQRLRGPRPRGGRRGRVRCGVTLDPNTRHPAALFQSLTRTHTHPRAVCHGPDRRYRGGWGHIKGGPKTC